MNEETTNMRVKISTRDFAKLLAPAIGMNMQEVTDFCLKEIAKRDAPWLISRGSVNSSKVQKGEADAK